MDSKFFTMVFRRKINYYYFKLQYINMNIKVLSLVFCVVIMGSCTPKITTSVTKAYSPLDYKEDVRVFGLEEDSPINAEVLGTVKIGDSGFTTDCGWDLVIEKAKLENFK